VTRPLAPAPLRPDLEPSAELAELVARTDAFRGGFGRGPEAEDKRRRRRSRPAPRLVAFPPTPKEAPCP
jgi:hypothetical protein